MARGRGIKFAIVSLIFFIIALGVTLGTYSAARVHGAGVYVGYSILFLLALLTAGRAIYYFKMKISEVEGPM